MNYTEKLNEFMLNGFNNWGNLAEQLDSSEMQHLDSFAMSSAVTYAMLSEYLGYRGSGGCGDHGHEEAMKQAEKKRKRIRKALGYSYPEL